MGRVTRKQAAEIAEQLHVDEDAVLDMEENKVAINAQLATPEPNNNRPALGEIEPNSAERSTADEEPVQELKKSTRGRKGAKKNATKGKKNDLAANTSQSNDVTPDELESMPSPASQKAVDDLKETGLEGEFGADVWA